MKKIKIFALLTMLCSSTISSFSTNHDSLYISPNPFDSITIIHFNIVHNDTITLQVYDRWGNAVRTFFQNTYLPSGSYSINFIADSLPYEMYLVGLFINSTTHLALAAYHLALGINENEIVKQKQFIYPNPTTGILNVSGKNIKSISIFDLSGKKIFTDIKKQDFVSIDISNIPKGIYIIKVEQQDSTDFEKIIIEWVIENQ